MKVAVGDSGLCCCPCVIFEDVPLVEFMYLVLTRMPGESYRRRLRSLLLCLCDVFQTLINSLVCCFDTDCNAVVACVTESGMDDDHVQPCTVRHHRCVHPVLRNQIFVVVFVCRLSSAN